MFNILGFSHHPSPAHQNNMGATHQMGAMHENNMGGGNNGGIGDLSKQILAEKAATGGEDPCCEKQLCHNSHLKEGASSLENCRLEVELCNITTVLDGNGNKVGERPADGFVYPLLSKCKNMLLTIYVILLILTGSLKNLEIYIFSWRRRKITTQASSTTLSCWTV